MQAIPFVIMGIGITLLAIGPLANYAASVLAIGVDGSRRRIIATDTWMEPLVSLAVLAAALWVILSGTYHESSEKWAFGAVGIILGYWLRGRRR